VEREGEGAEEGFRESAKMKSKISAML
jgi:hypothetical protein